MKVIVSELTWVYQWCPGLTVIGCSLPSGTAVLIDDIFIHNRNLSCLRQGVNGPGLSCIVRDGHQRKVCCIEASNGNIRTANVNVVHCLDRQIEGANVFADEPIDLSRAKDHHHLAIRLSRSAAGIYEP